MIRDVTMNILLGAVTLKNTHHAHSHTKWNGGSKTYGEFVNALNRFHFIGGVAKGEYGKSDKNNTNRSFAFAWCSSALTVESGVDLLQSNSIPVSVIVMMLCLSACIEAQALPCKPWNSVGSPHFRSGTQLVFIVVIHAFVQTIFKVTLISSSSFFLKVESLTAALSRDMAAGFNIACSSNGELYTFTHLHTEEDRGCSFRAVGTR